MQRVEHGQVALAGDAEGDLDPVHDELVDEELPAAPHVRASTVLEVHGGLLELRPVLVGRVDVANRALPRPLGGQDQDAHERGRRCCDAVASTGSGPDSNQAPPGPYEVEWPSVSMVEAAVEEIADPRPGMRVPVRDPARAGSRCDRTESPNPANGSSWMSPREKRSLGLLGAVVELPDERVPIDVGGAEVRRVVRDVVDDAAIAGRHGAVTELVEGEPHPRTTLSPPRAGRQAEARRPIPCHTRPFEWTGPSREAGIERVSPNGVETDGPAGGPLQDHAKRAERNNVSLAA